DFQELDLNWSQSADNNFVDHYNIYRSTSSSFIPSSSTLVGNTNQLFYQDTGLTANQTYYYYVLAVDQNGNLSAPSNEANAVTGTNAQNLIPVHISSISLSLGSTTATCTVTVVDNSGRAVSGVEVFGNWDEAARAADAAACIDTGVGTALLKKGWRRRRMTGERSSTSMSINDNHLAKVPVWQGVSGRNPLNSHSTPRPPHPRAASF